MPPLFDSAVVVGDGQSALGRRRQDNAVLRDYVVKTGSVDYDDVLDDVSQHDTVRVATEANLLRSGSYFVAPPALKNTYEPRKNVLSRGSLPCQVAL